MFNKALFLTLIQVSFLWCYEFTDQQVLDYHNGTQQQIENLDAAIGEGFFEGASSILDVGCGDGQVTARLAQQFPKIHFIGCDISKAMIEFAKRTYSYPNLEFIEKDACHLGYEHQFDRIVSFSALHWMEDQKQALTSIYQALKPNGKVLIRATPKTSNNDFKAISLKVILSFKWVSHFLNYRNTHSFHSERDYRKILTGIGFKVDRIEQKNKELCFENKEALIPFLKAILTPLSKIPPAKKDDFLADYYQELVKHGNVDENGVIHIHFDKVELALSKE